MATVAGESQWGIEMGSPSRSTAADEGAVAHTADPGTGSDERGEESHASSSVPLMHPEYTDSGPAAGLQADELTPKAGKGLRRLSVRTSNLREGELQPKRSKGTPGNGYHHVPAFSGTDDEALLLPRGEILSSDDEPLSPPLPPERRRHPIPPFLRWKMIAIFTLTASLLYADQNVMAPNLTVIADEFHMDPRERDTYLGGVVQGLFFVVGAPSALLVGYLCDKMNRRNLLFIVVILGEGPCLATFWVKHYWQLLLVRTLTGISLGGTLPLIFSLVGDLFWAENRAQVAAGIQLATGVGFGVGQGIAAITVKWLGWRWPFIIVAAPAIAMAFVTLTVPEPPRGVTEDPIQKHCEVGEGYEYKESINMRKVGRVLRTRSNLCCIGQGLPGSLPWGVILTYLNDFFVQEQRLSMELAYSVMLAFGIGGAVGVALGGGIGQWLYNNRIRFMPLFVAACVMSAVPPMLWVINAQLWRWHWMLIFLAVFLGGMLASPPGPNARAVLLGVNEPETRGMAVGMQTVMDDCGRGLGPALLASLLQIFPRMTRRIAFNIIILGWIPAGMLFALMSLYVVRDERAMQERLRDVAINTAHVPSHVDNGFSGAADAAGTPPLSDSPSSQLSLHVPFENGSNQAGESLLHKVNANGNVKANRTRDSLSAGAV